MIKIWSITFFCTAVILVTDNCAAVDTKKEGVILKKYSDESQNRYSDLLVDISRYTSNGALYHEKYQKLLIGLAAEIIEGKNLAIVPGTMGFYFDKKSSERNNLFLGLDIDAGTNPGEGYNATASSLIKHDLRDLIAIVHSCVSIFSEKEIIGMVIGWRWGAAENQNQVNIWMDKSDLIRFEEKKLTFDELVQRSVITNTAGKIIRVQL